MKRRESLGHIAAVLALCAVCAWATDALLDPASVLALAAMFTLC
ncbi:hypothetical protein [Pseudoduganella albidiflava]|uniref:Uncharacterized protein n=1 Tax=Pseudoduganella albidiflava TaxID=321983 RepID=A0AA87XSC8_9BURK|nr:hypothetical protein [Pseudoduganella albidiflava]GGY27213.1 hypothetical protein GCM10007387_06590 [Pseudoduganella albidiflava]